MKPETRATLAWLQSKAGQMIDATVKHSEHCPARGVPPGESQGWLTPEGDLAEPDCPKCVNRRKWCVELHKQRLPGHAVRFEDCGQCRAWSAHGDCRPGHWCGFRGACPRGSGDTGNYHPRPKRPISSYVR